MLDWLAPGRYVVKLTAYSVNQFGTNQMHDVVEEAFAFEKEQTTGKITIWLGIIPGGGYMMFPEIAID